MIFVNPKLPNVKEQLKEKSNFIKTDRDNLKD